MRSWFESPGVHHFPEVKRAITDLVMAPGRKPGNWSASGYITPAVVGRLMPTLIRTRVVAARNMFF
jgi:hypothetical protein